MRDWYPQLSPIIQIFSISYIKNFIALGYLRLMLALYPYYYGSRRIVLVLVFPWTSALPQFTRLVSYQGRVYLRQVTDSSFMQPPVNRQLERFSLLLRQPQACHTNTLDITTLPSNALGFPIQCSAFEQALIASHNDSVTKVSFCFRSCVWTIS